MITFKLNFYNKLPQGLTGKKAEGSELYKMMRELRLRCSQEITLPAAATRQG
jgi:hypothetical protein